MTTIADPGRTLMTPAFLDEGSILRVFSDGQSGTVFNSPLGLMTATGSRGAWSAPTQLDPTYGVGAAGGPSGAQSVQVFEPESRVVARAGLTPNTPLTVLTDEIPGVTEGSPNLIHDGQKDLAARCGIGDNAGGGFVQISITRPLRLMARPRRICPGH